MGHRGYANNLQKRSIKSQGQIRLANMYRAGRGISRGENKRNGATGAAEEREQIHTSTTLQTYQRAWSKYCDWLSQHQIHCGNIDDAATHIQSYIDSLQSSQGKTANASMSAASIATNLAGICKVCGVSATSYNHPAVARADISRSRNQVNNDKHFSESKNTSFVSFCQSTGLRKGKELSALRGTDLIRKADGQYYIHVPCGKGGKERDAIIYGSDDEIRAVVNRMQAAGNNKVWENIPTASDVHSYRRDYAAKVYASKAREQSDIPPEERYCCRGDKAGIWYDRKALEYVSEQLGHSRASIVAEHYLD